MYLGRNVSWPRHSLGERLFQVEQAASTAEAAWAPRVDIKEDDKRFVILADIPGIDPAGIEVSMDKGVLTIKGERTQEAPAEGDRYTRVERAHGAFLRRFALPDSADAEGITAHGRNGVLEVSIPKRAETAPRRINIEITH
ncbi:Hsp20/alpha crystallin family protein [Dyella sp. 2RAB6]|uniref:Hsp20/alpha crystallin family protein n=1 Tax=Dyella sp. 2RAB6 TaxID=3232992 RepID=UPI003F92929B